MASTLRSGNSRWRGLRQLTPWLLLVAGLLLVRFSKGAGFTDAYRTAYPDEMKNPGFTWSPMYKLDDATTHHDRIDFVYFKGSGLKLETAKIVGENKANADIVISPYPSDHRAVLAAFSLSPPPKPSVQTRSK